MQLPKLLNEIDYEVISGEVNININHISYHSNNIINSSLFICIKGKIRDGHSFIDEAIGNGAVAILLDNVQNITFQKNICYIKVNKVQDILSCIANKFYGVFLRELTYTAVTGTNGKTTTANIISFILNYYNHTAGTIGTLDNCVRESIINIPKTNPTTPNCIELAKTIIEMSNLSAKHIIMEVSSMALEMQRVKTFYYKAAVFTNLTLDHLDDHITFDNYKNAKLKLFHMCEYAIVNNDEMLSKKICQIPDIKIITYAIDNDADFKATNIFTQNGTMIFDLIFNKKTYHIALNLLGKFNVYNTLASIAACHVLGVNIEDSIKALYYMNGIPGRFEMKLCKNGVISIVDYAHTPDALINILKTARAIAKKKLFLVFGCGGDRDISKRAIMSKIAVTYADYSFVTSDNPRTENPVNIIRQIECGMHDKNKYETITDRKQAIYKALSVAEKDDIVIIAGKGDENYQEINGVKYHYSDRETVDEFDRMIKSFKYI